MYYGLSLGVSDLGTNLYLTQFLFGLVEIPARSMALFFLPYSRRFSQSVFLALGGATCLLMLIVPEGDQHLHSSQPLFKNGIFLVLLSFYRSFSFSWSYVWSIPSYHCPCHHICSLFVLVSLTLSFLSVIYPDSPKVRAAVAMTGKFGITASFAVIYVYTAELFPTVLRYLFIQNTFIQNIHNYSVLYSVCVK